MDIQKLLQELTLAEKCSLVVGRDAWHTVAIPRLGISSIMMADGPSGLRKQLDSGTGVQAAESYHSVCYPPAATVAASFDVDLAEAMGKAIAEECRAKDVQVLLAPGVNIKRSPLCGRNFEYYSEDPHLSGEMGAAFVRGVEKKNVGACVKHYALNNQESYRMTSSSVCDRRAFREIYTPAFARCVAENPAMVMCSYNRVDDVYAAENRFLLNDTLRTAFGFNNVIVSDWSAVSDRGNSIRAGLDLEMPGHAYAVRKLAQDVTKGIVAMSELDACVKHMLHLVAKYGSNPLVVADLEENHRKAQEIAAGSIVLLKNDDAILPLSSTQKIAVVGKLAETPRYQGGGSSHVNPYRIDSFLDQLPKAGLWDFAEGYRLEGDGYDQALIDQAKSICQGKDKVLLFVGLTDEYESE
ncbi:MAG: glycoside hydrolase family 3 N-terminal domain-containing protein, partial [bacterium]